MIWLPVPHPAISIFGLDSDDESAFVDGRFVIVVSRVMTHVLVLQNGDECDLHVGTKGKGSFRTFTLLQVRMHQ